MTLKPMIVVSSPKMAAMRALSNGIMPIENGNWTDTESSGWIAGSVVVPDRFTESLRDVTVNAVSGDGSVPMFLIWNEIVPLSRGVGIESGKAEPVSRTENEVIERNEPLCRTLMYLSQGR